MEVQKSSKSGKELKVEMPNAFAHSNKVWMKDSFKSWINLSFPSKVGTFLSLQIPHMRQWGSGWIWRCYMFKALLFNSLMSSHVWLPCSSFWISSIFWVLILLGFILVLGNDVDCMFWCSCKNITRFKLKL